MALENRASCERRIADALRRACPGEWQEISAELSLEDGRATIAVNVSRTFGEDSSLPDVPKLGLYFLELAHVESGEGQGLLRKCRFTLHQDGTYENQIEYAQAAPMAAASVSTAAPAVAQDTALTPSTPMPRAPVNSKRRRSLLILLGMMAIMMGGLVFTLAYTSRHATTTEQWAKKQDPLLAGLFANNPGIKFDDASTIGGSRRTSYPFYWIIDDQTASKIMLPKSEASHATVRVMPCLVGDLPAGYSYPDRVIAHCVEVHNDSHTIDALTFDTNDTPAQVVHFYEQLLPENKRSPAVEDKVYNDEGVREDEQRDPDSQQLIYSMLLYGRNPLHVFIGFREERTPRP